MSNEAEFVDVIVRIRNNKTQEIREIVSKTGQIENGKYDDYIWMEGNASCDCNRSGHFREAGNESWEERVPCSTEVYSIQLLIPETREVFYSEFED